VVVNASVNANSNPLSAAYLTQPSTPFKSAGNLLWAKHYRDTPKRCTRVSQNISKLERMFSMIKKLLSVVLAMALSLFPIGCEDVSASGSVSVGDTTVSGTISVTHRKKFQPLRQDAIVTASQPNNTLVDVPPGFIYNASNPPQAVITITTDTGQISAQSFNLVPASTSGFAPAASGTQTYAFAAQDSSAVSAFVQSAASNASSTVTVDIQSKIWFQGPTDGGSYTVYGRDYNASAGVQNVGSATYTAPLDRGTGPCRTRICPNQ
jgi:hypothetical protein